MIYDFYTNVNDYGFHPVCYLYIFTVAAFTCPRNSFMYVYYCYRKRKQGGRKRNVKRHLYRCNIENRAVFQDRAKVLHIM